MFFTGRTTFARGELDDQYTEEKAEVVRIAREVFEVDWEEDESNPSA